MNFVTPIKYQLKRIVSHFIKNVSVATPAGTLVGRVHDFGTLRAIRSGRLEPTMQRLFVSAIRPGAAVADVGAHLGLYSLIAARQTGRSGVVYAFEAAPDTFRYLQGNVERNQLQGIIKPQQMAVADASGELTFHFDVFQPDFSSLRAQRTEAQINAVEVKATSLDDFFLKGDRDRPLPEVLKIDIEGAEMGALKGGERFFAQARPTLFIECNPEALSAFGTTPSDLRDKLISMGFSIQAIDEGLGQTKPLSAEHLSRCLNWYCLPT